MLFSTDLYKFLKTNTAFLTSFLGPIIETRFPLGIIFILNSISTFFKFSSECPHITDIRVLLLNDNVSVTLFISLELFRLLNIDPFYNNVPCKEKEVKDFILTLTILPIKSSLEIM